ncbi:MAG TPA: NAD-dependent deacylase [Longimicrobiales bacterium]|nr:NAD-dependent deacylase [Longimicrobiales bacterium]
MAIVHRLLESLIRIICPVVVSRHHRHRCRCCHSEPDNARASSFLTAPVQEPYESMPEVDSLLQQAAAALRAARHVVVLTGAGVSKDSGLPTFREAQTGLWARYRPEDLATPEAFARQPDVVWRWYAWRRELVARAEPNAGHRAIAALQERLRGSGTSLTLVTQNVDGLHVRAGSPDVVELHGNIGRIVCSRCRHAPAEPGAGEPPNCALCGAPLRPDVVWFGEVLPEAALNRAVREAAECDVFLSVGTSGLVYPAAGLVQVARRHGAAVIVVNPDDDVVPGALWLRGSASEMLPALLAALDASGASQ